MTSIHPNIFWFLSSIKEHNTRDFFSFVRPLYDQIQENLLQRTAESMSELHRQLGVDFGETKPKECMFRIYRDARRLKEWNLIYKENFAIMISPSGKNDSRSNWFYLHIQPGGSFLAGWLYMSEPADLARVRKFLSSNGEKYYKIISNPEFVKTFGSVTWSSLTRLPKWFEQYADYLELIKMKQFLIQKSYTDQEVLSEDFMSNYIHDCKIAKPFLNFINKWCEYDW